MERIVQKIKFAPQMPKALRVAAYARVSSGKDAMLHSLSAQVDFYSTFIRHHPGWEYVGVYADEAKTGTVDGRENFQRLLADCRSGKIDRVLTKSVSRFARNTVTLLKAVRELKSLGIGVYFEEQNIDTSTADGELMLTILAGFAEEESLSVSENQKWRVRKNFEDGKPWRFFMLGYRRKDGRLEVVPKEAELVRFIFNRYLDGDGVTAIMKKLNESGSATQSGHMFHKSAVERILRNYAYTGNLLLQTKFRENHLTKKTLRNNGELPKFHATETHEPIVTMETFMSVQDEMALRAEKYAHTPTVPTAYPFTGMLICDNCGKHYRRKVTATGPVWICSTYNRLGKEACPSKQIPEETLYDVSAEALGLEMFDADAFHNNITAVRVLDGNSLVFVFHDGQKAVKRWQDRSRSESWTEEMRSAASRRTRERNERNAQG